MDPSREQFDAQVARLERVAARSPRAYKARVVALGALGYAYLLTALLLMVGMLAGLALLAAQGKGLGLVVKLGLPLLVLVGAVGRALWVRLEPPEGRVLARGPAHAALWAEVDRVRAALKGPRIHRLLLTDDFNAAIVQLPLFGLLGPTRNYLVLGLPLLQALSPEHFRSVLAHEFGHLSGAHGALGAWVYRVRKTWSQVQQSLESHEGWVVGLFTRFFRWYAPYYAAYSFVLARANEYEADRASADVVGAAAAADALVAVSVRDGLLEERFWPGVRKLAGKQPEPVSPYAQMPAALGGPVEPALAQGWLAQALGQATGTADTHPSLTDRLAALGQAPRLPAPLQQSAAQVLLGAGLPALVAELDTQWRERVAENWAQRYAEVQQGEQRIAALRAKAAAAPLSPRELFELARTVEELHEGEDVLPLYQQVFDMDPSYFSARFNVGRLLLARGDEAGLGVLEEMMARDIHAVALGCQLAADFLAERGRLDEARAYAQRGEHWEEQVLPGAKEERGSLKQGDTFAPHGVTDAAVLERLLAGLGAHPRVKRAWFARKVVVHLPHSPLYVLGVEAEGAWEQGANQQLVQELVDALLFPGEAFVVAHSQKNAGLFERLREAAGAPLYERDRQASLAS